MRRKAVIGIILGVCLAVGQAWALDDAIIEIDNEAAAIVGAWNTWPAPPNNNDNTGNYYGPNYRYINCTGAGGAAGSTVTWNSPVALENSGVYSVYMMWAQHTNRSTQVPVVVCTRPNITGTCYGLSPRDQEQNGGKWVRLGGFSLEAGWQPSVRITNSCPNEADGAIVTADAVRFVKEQVSAVDILDESGIQWGGKGSQDISTLASCSAADWTNVRQFTIVAPSGGYVHLTAAGYARLTQASRYVRVCISNQVAGSSCLSQEHTLEVTELGPAFTNDKAFALSKVVSVPAGSRVFFLKACKQVFVGTGATGTLYWDDFTGLYVRTLY